MTNTLKQHAQKLRLSGLLNSLELRLQEAEANRLPYAQFLELLFQDEINVRHQRLLKPPAPRVRLNLPASTRVCIPTCSIRSLKIRTQRLSHRTQTSRPMSLGGAS
jgi:hypothetical protein